MTPGRAVRSSLLALLAAAFAVSVATARAVADGEARLADTDAALRRQDFAAATVSAREAAGWYVPGAPHVAAAYARLLHIARTTEANGDRDAALFAWRAMRASAIDTAWLAQPHARELDMANAAIARLTADAPRPGAPGDDSPAAARRTRELLAREQTPRAPWIAALALSLSAVLAGGVALVARGVSPEGELRWARARLPALVVAGGFVVYALAAWQA